MIERDRELVLSVSGSPLMRKHLEEGLACRNRTVLSFPNVEEGARAIAERIRERVQRLSFTGTGKQPFSVTASFGVAFLDNSMAGPAELIEAADSCLYIAKSSGRNMAVVFQR